MGLLKLSSAQEAIVAWVDPQTQHIDKEPVVDGKLPGLANLGNTCFANSVLQCLLNTPGWFPEACLAFSHFEESTPKGSPSKAGLGRAFQSLAREYGSMADGALQKSNSSLKNMKDAIAAIDPQYAGCQQQDAYEFLGCLLEGLEQGFGALFHGAHGGPCAGPNADVIRAICGVKTHTRRVCHSCSGCFEVDCVTDTAMRLPLLSPSAQFDAALHKKEEDTPITLQELMDAVRKPETIEGYDCDKCRAGTPTGEDCPRSVITQHAGVIADTRDVMVVVLYRFGHALDAAGNFKPVKVKRQVAVPTKFDVESKSYSLFGVVSHLGSSLTAGHYVAAVRSRRDGMWYECNDETVTPLTMKALYDGRAVTSVRPGAEPYILFYHRDAVEADAAVEAEAAVQQRSSTSANLADVTAQTVEVPSEMIPFPAVAEGATAASQPHMQSAATDSSDAITHTEGNEGADSKGPSEESEDGPTEHGGGGPVEPKEVEVDDEWVLVKAPSPIAESASVAPVAAATSTCIDDGVHTSQLHHGEEQRVAPKRKPSNKLFARVLRRGLTVDEAADPGPTDGSYKATYATESTESEYSSFFFDTNAYQWLY